MGSVFISSSKGRNTSLILNMEKEVTERLEKLRYMQEELGLDVPEGVTVEEDEKGFQALQSKILNQISEVKDVLVFLTFLECLANRKEK